MHNGWYSLVHKKIKLMTHTRKKIDYPPINFNVVQLEFVVSHKHLGAILSTNHVWSSHINNVFESIGSVSDILKKLKYDLERTSLE